MSEPLRVVAGVLIDRSGRVLIAQRPVGKPMAGYWEFPGGKLEAGESPEQALRRELREELGVEMRGCHALLQLRHDYAQRTVDLKVFIVDESSGEPSGLEGQAVRWVSLAQLSQERLLPANTPIVEALIAALNSSEGIAHGPGPRTAGHCAR